MFLRGRAGLGAGEEVFHVFLFEGELVHPRGRCWLVHCGQSTPICPTEVCCRRVKSPSGPAAAELRPLLFTVVGRVTCQWCWRLGFLARDGKTRFRPIANQRPGSQPLLDSISFLAQTLLLHLLAPLPAIQRLPRRLPTLRILEEKTQHYGIHRHNIAYENCGNNTRNW